jgi:DNA repair photolyase
MKNVLYTIARKGKVITESGFSGYDFALNPYVGCEFGCRYCYVRFFVKDAEKPWGEFVRRREHLVDRLPKELKEVAGKRLVLGTMTDPYQPEERRSRLTRAALGAILAGPLPAKVGIFTRSPIVLDDAGLIARLPRARVHYSVTPFDREIMTKIEGIPVTTEARWKAVLRLREAGVRVHVNVAPAIPVVSDAMTREFCEKLASSGVSEFFVDPMQAYSDSFRALEESMKGHPAWDEVRDVMTDKPKYAAWKRRYRASWEAEWKKVGSPDVLPIWSDHEHKTWIDMRTGADMSKRAYGDDLVAS